MKAFAPASTVYAITFLCASLLILLQRSLMLQVQSFIYESPVYSHILCSSSLSLIMTFAKVSKSLFFNADFTSDIALGTPSFAHFHIMSGSYSTLILIPSVLGTSFFA